MAAVALGVAAALCWGCADFLGGIRARRLTLATVLLGSQLTGLAVVAAVVGVAGLEAPAGEDVVPAVIAGVSQLVGIAALYRALAIGTMSVISPVSASGAAAVPVIVAIATGERPDALQATGMVAAFTGVFLATRVEQAATDGGDRREGLALSAVAALGFGGFYVGMDAAIDGANPFWALLVARSAAMAVLLVALAGLRPGLGGDRGLLPSLALIGLLDVGANACFALGADTGLLSVVAVLASLYPVATVVLARALLGERLVPIQAAGVTIALAGVALIAAG
jgi:drug/metabolite transporter (DMT)-like permease